MAVYVGKMKDEPKGKKTYCVIAQSWDELAPFFFKLNIDLKDVPHVRVTEKQAKEAETKGAMPCTPEEIVAFFEIFKPSSSPAAEAPIKDATEYLAGAASAFFNAKDNGTTLSFEGKVFDLKAKIRFGNEQRVGFDILTADGMLVSEFQGNGRPFVADAIEFFKAAREAT